VGVSFTAFRSGYTLVETWHATSVLHRLRLLRAFRCYPSRENKVKNIVLLCNMFFFKGIKHELRGRGRSPRPRKTPKILINKKKCFLPFNLWGRVGGKLKKPKKNTSFALGMRRACVSMVQRTEAKRSP